jgi:multiple sugar transport system substrate-binding protein
MFKQKLNILLSLLLLFSMLLAACQTATTEPVAPAAPVEEEPTEVPKPGPITLWTKFNDTNPQNTQDEWLKSMLAAIKTDTGLEVTNVFVPFDQINTKLNLAVQAGGDIPDISYMDNQNLGFFYTNGTLMDLTDFVKSAPWFSSLNPAALKACTAPDGKIYCVPSNVAGRWMYYWTAAFPNGFPATTDDLMAVAADLKADGKFAVTFQASAMDGLPFSLIKSFGGTIGDAQGKVAWASPETVKAIEFLRMLFVEGYAPDVDLAPGFEFETPFKDGSSASFFAGSWSYVYLNPLTSFDGKAFDMQAASVEEALKAGVLGTAAPLSAPGGKPYASVASSAWAIPIGSGNVDGAKAFINYQMEATRNADFAISYGALPVLTESMSDPRFANSPYWVAFQKIIAEYGVAPDPLVEYSKASQKMGETVVTLIQKPDLDILTELQRTQDELNAGQ